MKVLLTAICLVMSFGISAADSNETDSTKAQLSEEEIRELQQQQTLLRQLYFGSMNLGLGYTYGAGVYGGGAYTYAYGCHPANPYCRGVCYLQDDGDQCVTHDGKIYKYSGENINDDKGTHPDKKIVGGERDGGPVKDIPAPQDDGSAESGAHPAN